MAKKADQQALGARHGVAVLAVSEVETIALSKIRVDGGTQARAGLREETVEEYREVMEAAGGWGEFPKVEVVYDGETHWLTDGYHRAEAARRLFGDMQVPAEILPGDFDYAILRAVKANATHGLRRSNADKRRAVAMLLGRPAWQGLGDPAIAEVAGVSARFVGMVRQELEQYGSVPVVEVRTGQDGRKINVSKIGRATKPVVAPPPTPPRERQPEKDVHPGPAAARVDATPEFVTVVLPRRVATKLHQAVVKNSLKMFLTPAENESLTAALTKVLLETM